MATQLLTALVVDWSWLGQCDHRPHLCVGYLSPRQGARFRQCSVTLSVAKGLCSIALNETPIIIPCHEANLLALCLCCHAHATLSRHCPHLGLGVRPQWKAGMGKLLLVEHMQHI